MNPQIFEITRAPEEPSLTAIELRRLIWQARPNSEWGVMNHQTISKRIERARTLLASAVEKLMDIDEMNGREDIYSLLDEVHRILYAVAQATDPSPFDP